MDIRYRSIMLVIVAAGLSTVAQVIFKIASGRASLSVEGILLNWPLILGFGLYGVVALIFVLALKGGELTVLYPLLATSYIGVALVSPLLFPSDSLTILKVVGIVVIIGGVYCVGKGMKYPVEVV